MIISTQKHIMGHTEYHLLFARFFLIKYKLFATKNGAKIQLFATKNAAKIQLFADMCKYLRKFYAIFAQILLKGTTSFRYM